MSYLVLMDLVKVHEQTDDSISRATMPSILDHYIQRPSDGTFNHMTLLHFAQHYSMPKELGTVPKKHKMMIVNVRPYCSPDPNGPKYEQYCQQKLMLHVPFRHIDQLKGTSEKFSDAYLIFLQSANLPSSLEDDIRRLSEHQYEEEGANTNEVLNIILCTLICTSLFLFTGIFYP